MTTRDQLEEIVQRGDPEEWLRVVLHESTRANNAEDLLREAERTLRLAVHAFAQYAEESNDPSDEALAGFESGFRQQARAEIMLERRQARP